MWLLYKGSDKDAKNPDESLPLEAPIETEDGTDVAELPDVEVVAMETDPQEDVDPPVSTSSDKRLCSASNATRIHKTIVTSLLPQLHKVITQKVSIRARSSRRK